MSKMDQINGKNREKIVLYQENTSSEDDNDDFGLQQFKFMKSQLRWSFIALGKYMQISGHLQTLHGYKETEKWHFQECSLICERSVDILEFWKQIIKPHAFAIFRFIPKDEEQEELMLQLYKNYMDMGKIGEIFNKDKYLCVVPIQPGHWYPHTQHCCLGPSCRGFRVYRECLFVVLFHKSDLNWV